MKGVGFTTELHALLQSKHFTVSPAGWNPRNPEWIKEGKFQQSTLNFFLLHYFRTLNRGHKTFTCHDLWQSNSLVKVTPITNLFYLVRLTSSQLECLWNPFGSEKPPMTTYLNQKETGHSMKGSLAPSFAEKHFWALLTLNKWYLVSLGACSFWGMC